MERSNEELCESIVAYELILDAVRTVVEKGELSPADEEHVILSLHTTSAGSKEIEFLCRDVEDGLKILTEPPCKREIPALKSLVEKELNQTFGTIEQLDSVSGFFGKTHLLTEHDILENFAQIQNTSTRLVSEHDMLLKRGKTVSQLFKESWDPIVDSATALKSELLQNISEIRQIESSVLHEKFKHLPNDALERLVNDLEEEVKAGDDENGVEEPEMNEELAAAALKLNLINEEIALKQAALEAFFS